MEIKLVEDGYLTWWGSTLVFIILGFIIFLILLWGYSVKLKREGAKDNKYKVIINKTLTISYEELKDELKSKICNNGFQLVKSIQHSQDCLANIFVREMDGMLDVVYLASGKKMTEKFLLEDMHDYSTEVIKQYRKITLYSNENDIRQAFIVLEDTESKVTKEIKKFKIDVNKIGFISILKNDKNIYIVKSKYSLMNRFLDELSSIILS